MKLFRMGFFAVLLAMTVGAVGQTNPGDVVVDVPFAFSVAGERLPAGHYIVAAQNDFIKISNSTTRGLYIPTHAAVRTKATGGKVVFHRYGDRFFLSAVWITGSTTGKELFPSRNEREMKARRSEMELAVVRPVQ